MEKKEFNDLYNKITDIEKYNKVLKSFEGEINNWNKDTFTTFCKCDDIAGRGRMFFYNNTIEKLWSEQEQNLKEDIQKLKKDIRYFETFKKNIQGYIGDSQPKPLLAINRMAVALHPDILCRTIDEKKLRYVYRYLNIKTTDENGNDINWIDLNQAIMQKLDELQSKFKTEYNKKELGSIPWVIYEEIGKYKKFTNILNSHKNVILNGAPGTGKTYLAKKIAAEIIGNGYTLDNVHKSEQFEFVQFHPSYDYTDFVEGLRPVQETNKKDISFELKPGIFKKFCIKALEAWKKAEKKENAPKYIFIIDEINRGEISKIFGELFFSIDPGYRGKKGKIYTQYANMQTTPNEFDEELGDNGNYGHFFVPDNVYIIGTMNDIDRSVENMDFAFRRRFAFYEITADDSKTILNSLIEDNQSSKEKEKAKSIKNKAENAMLALNNKIVEQGLTPSYQIGGSYFLKLKETEYNFDELWDIYLYGTLYEYFRGEPEAENKLDALKKAYFNAINPPKPLNQDNTNDKAN